MTSEEIKKQAEYCLNCKTKPCKSGCPLEINIPEFIQYIKKEDFEKAYEVLAETTILQPVCGRICPYEKQCQGNCARGIKGEPVQIGKLEAFIGDMALKNGYMNSKRAEKTGKKVAIIGGGPTGLTAVVFLVNLGHEVTIYEKHDYLGGLLMHGIPEFRLDRKMLDNWINSILSTGLEVKYNKALGIDYTLEELQKEYDAVFLSFGANISCSMGIVGENLDGVYGGNELLEANNHPDYKGKRVAVIGGGNTAMDTARIIKHLGAKEVSVIYRRAQKQMPAEKKEIEDAKKEGVKFLFQNNILKIFENEQNKVCKIECIKTELVKKENEKREVPVNVEGSNYELDIDYVIMAVGSKTQGKIVKNLELELDKKGYIKTDEKNMTSKLGVFAGGDLVGTKSTVAWAARSGRDAAYEIDKYLHNY